MIIIQSMIVLILVFVRMTAILILTPMFNNKNVPSMAKIGFIFFLSYAIMPIVLINTGFYVLTFLDLFKYIVIEFINGIAFGFIITLSFSFIYIAGLLVDRNIGFAMVSVLNPQDESQIPISANVYFLFLILLFFTANLHHKLIEAILKTYEVLPMGESIIDYKLVYFYTDIMTQAFIAGIQIASPFILTLLVANVILGLLSKAMPGMNVFLIGLPLKVFVGLVTFIIVIQYYYDVFIIHLINAIDNIYKLIGM